MSDSNISDTGNVPGGESLPPNTSVDQGMTPASGDTDDFVPEYSADGQPQPVPYDRFKESRGQLRELRGQFESTQHELQLQRDVSTQQQQQLQYYNNLMQQQSAMTQQPQAEQEPNFIDVGQGSFDDPYADPQDVRMKALEQQVQQMRHQSSQREKAIQDQQQAFSSYQAKDRQEKIAREIEGNLDHAIGRFPGANKYWIYDQLMRGQGHDARNLEILAKRSHEETMEGRRQWAAQGGYRPPSRPLMNSNTPMAAPQDFGDNLDMAEAAAIERLRNMS